MALITEDKKIKTEIKELTPYFPGRVQKVSDLEVGTLCLLVMSERIGIITSANGYSGPKYDVNRGKLYAVLGNEAIKGDYRGQKDGGVKSTFLVAVDDNFDPIPGTDEEFLPTQSVLPLSARIDVR